MLIEWCGENNMNEKRVLVVSNNVFSDIKNNGKTLKSFFRKFKEENIAQLFFSNEQIQIKENYNFYSISERNFFNIMNKKNNLSETIDNFTIKTNKTPIKRIIREFIWKTKFWRKKELENWIMNFKPDIIFFCAGDSIFAYDIIKYILKITNAKLVTYVTDDYFLPRKHSEITEKIRLFFVRNKFIDCLENTQLLITISQKMSNEYKHIFDKESLVFSNIPESLFDDTIKIEKKDEYFHIVYAGGLHLNRWRTLVELIKNISIINKSYEKKIFIDIYSTTEINHEIIKQLNTVFSKFHGRLSKNEIKVVLNNADALLHVESFLPSDIEKTKLSISTKISEYLSIKKPIIVLGPSSIASVEFLTGSAIVFDEFSNINKNELIKLLYSESYRDKLVNSSEKLYSSLFKTNNTETFYKIINTL